jgi:hypothetical protein
VWTPVIGAVVRPFIAAIVVVPYVGVLGEESERPVWLAVGRKTLIEPLEPLVETRRREGFTALVSTERIDRALADAPRAPRFLLLVGDDEPGCEQEPWHLAAKRTSLYRWRAVQREQFASDALWGDLDGDLIPEIAVGRIPARTAGQVTSAVEKILRFEGRPAASVDLRLLVWAGSPEYGPAIDALATQLLIGMVQSTGPRWARPWIISGDPAHSLSGWPPDQAIRFTRKMHEGGLCAVLMGHADADRFFSMTHQGRAVWYTAADAQRELESGPPSPPMIFFSCESGNFTRPSPCLSESFFLFLGGPVATIAATTESHPLANYFSGTCLLRELSGGEERIGTLWLAAQRRAMRERHLLVEHVLRDIEGKLEDEIDVSKLRRDQMLMYALLGDPATRIRLPKPLEASVRRTEEGWRWQATRPPEARRLEVGHRPAGPISLPVGGAAVDEHEARAAFEAANDALGFTPVPTPREGSPWQGVVDRPGWLRLVAVAGSDLYVATLKLE